MHQDPTARERYHALVQSIEELTLQVKGAQQIDELRRLDAEVDSTVKQWIHHFQIMVSDLTGTPRPEAPVFLKP